MKMNFVIIGAMIFGVIILAAIFGLNGAGYFALGETDNSTIKIGFIAPLTGPSASTGVSSKQGFEFANIKNPMINGKKIVVVFEDDKADPAIALSAAKKLVEIDGVKIIVSAFSGSTLAIAPYSNDNNFLLASTLAASPKLSGAGKYFFRVVPPSTQLLKDAGRITYEKGFRKAAILYELNDYTVGWKDAFEKSYTANGGVILAEEAFNSKDSDYRTQLTKLENSRADLIVIAALSAQSGLNVLKQARELEINTKMLGNEVFGFTSIVTQNDMSDGIMVTEYAWNQNDGKGKEFVFEYSKEFPNTDSILYAALGYDTYMALFNAIWKCNENASCIKEEVIKQGDVEGAAGEYKVLENGDAERETTIHIIENGKLEALN